MSKLPLRGAASRQRSSFSVPFEEVYGFRGRDASLYYLNPWEFTKWWSVEYLKPPSAYKRKFDAPKTKWLDGGLEHWRRTLKDPTLPGVEPGTHYVVLEPCALPAEYVTFPNDEATQELRHRAVLVRNARPFVPEPEGTPMPTQRFSAEERGRMLSVYLKPLVLHRWYASRHVPHIADLDICVPASLQQRRMSTKTGSALLRDFGNAWRDYRTRRVVSEHAARTIRNFLATQLAESAEADAAEEESAKRVPWEAVDTSWVSLQEIRNIVGKNVALQSESTTQNPGGKINSWEQRVAIQNKDIDSWWAPNAMSSSASGSASASSTSKVDTDGCVPANLTSLPETSKSAAASSKAVRDVQARAATLYRSFNRTAADEWLLRLTTAGSSAIVPSDEQKLVLQDVIDRCFAERVEEEAEVEIKSEPLRLFLHGVPGAGKSKLLEWIRTFFEAVLGWTHGVEFVYLASQHTMAALIGGFTIHSFGNVKFRKPDGALANNRAGKAKDMSAQFLKYERLRLLFIDECSTASAENQAEMEHNIRKSIRLEQTWATGLRTEDGKLTQKTRCWGGVNLFQAGDMWQFKPVKATAIFNIPLKAYPSAGVNGIMAGFWSKSEDSINLFRELTTERRCKDPWLRHVLHGATHGTQSHEVYCFMHGLPTKHPGSFLPATGEMICGNSDCAALAAKWTQQVLSASSSWEARRSQECAVCDVHRKRRCRVVGTSEMSPDMFSWRFIDAPFIHALNAPKQHASQRRAVHLASRQNRVLLWCVAEDKPLHNDETCLTDDMELRRKKSWLTRHDQQTGGITGLLPLVKGMPIRLTKTVQRHLDKRLFPNNKGKLHGWQLDDVDQERLRNNTSDEMVLQFLPQKLYIEMPNATWIVHEEFGPGIIAIKPEIEEWALDRARKVRVKRRGFCMAPDLAGTAHSFVGATLKAALLDLDKWEQEPNHDTQLSGYMCLSRAEEIEGICIVKPFSPNLFRNGDLRGPDLLLKFQRKDISEEQMAAAWRTESKKVRKPNNWHYMIEMQLFCRGCSETAGEQVYKAAKEFPKREVGHLWQGVIALGMERFCLACSNARAGAARP